MPGVWKATYASGLSSVPVCWSRLRLEGKPDVNPLCEVRDTGATTFDCIEDDWVEVTVSVLAG